MRVVAAIGASLFLVPALPKKNAPFLCSMCYNLRSDDIELPQHKKVNNRTRFQKIFMETNLFPQLSPPVLCHTEIKKKLAQGLDLQFGFSQYQIVLQL